MNIKHIYKQLDKANTILNDIEKEYSKKSLKYGKFAYEVQLKEVKRLSKLISLFKNK
jgi:hypothetical protein